MILLILSPISLSPLRATMSAKLPPSGTSISASGLPGVLVGDVLDEEQDEDVVLVLRGVHAAAQLVAACPEGAVEFGFLDGHLSISLDGANARFRRRCYLLCHKSTITAIQPASAIILHEIECVGFWSGFRFLCGAARPPPAGASACLGGASAGEGLPGRRTRSLTTFGMTSCRMAIVDGMTSCRTAVVDGMTEGGILC